MKTPSAAMIAITSIWNLCSTAEQCPQAKENHGVPVAHLLLALRRHTDEGHDVGSANYKARLNLRVSLATAAKLGVLAGKGNKPQPDTIYEAASLAFCLLAGGRSGRTYSARPSIDSVVDSRASRASNSSAVI